MFYILIFILIAFSIFSYFKERNLYNPIFLMNIMWFFFTVLSYLAFYGIDRPRDSTYFMILIGILSYNYGVLFLNNKFVALKKRVLNKNIFILNYKLLYFLYLFVIVFLLYESYSVINLLLNGHNMDYIRMIYAKQLEGSSFVLNFRGYISTPIVYLSLPVLVIDFLNGKKDKLLIIYTIILVTLWVISSGGGRSILIWLIIYFVIALMIFRKKMKIKLSNSAKILLIIFLTSIVVFMVYMSVERRMDFDIFKEIYVYFGVPIIHMQYRIDIIESFYPYYYGFGFSSLNGFVQPTLFLFNNINIINHYPDFYLLTKELSFDILEQGIDVGGEIKDMNAFATIFYQFYLDGRLLGVILGMFLFGLVVSHFYSKMMYTLSNKYVLIYLLLAQKIVFSMVRFYFTQVNQTISFILAFLIFVSIFKRKKQKYF